MYALSEQPELTFYAVDDDSEIILLPKFQTKVECGGSTTGFASPADDHIETHLDLNEFHNIRRHGCFLVEAVGDSMIDAGISEKDVLIVDTTMDYREGDIVICSVDGIYKAKLIKRVGQRLFLISKNPTFEPIEIKEHDDFKVFGVVKGLSRNFRRS